MITTHVKLGRVELRDLLLEITAQPGNANDVRLHFVCSLSLFRGLVIGAVAVVAVLPGLGVRVVLVLVVDVGVVQVQIGGPVGIGVLPRRPRVDAVKAAAAVGLFAKRRPLFARGNVGCSTNLQEKINVDVNMV